MKNEDFEPLEGVDVEDYMQELIQIQNIISRDVFYDIDDLEQLSYANLCNIEFICKLSYIKKYFLSVCTDMIWLCNALELYTLNNQRLVDITSKKTFKNITGVNI